MNNPSEEQKEEGFTIVDILVGIVLFVILIPLTSTAIIAIRSINTATNTVADAVYIVTSKASRLQSTPFDSIVVGGPYAFSDGIPDDFPEPHSASYIVAIRSGNPNIKDITINLQYTQNGATRTKEYKTSVGAVQW